VPVEHRVHRALGRDPDVAGHPPHQEFADLARAPVRLVALGRHDQPLHRLGQLVGIAHRPARPVGEGLDPVALVAIEDLVAGLARDAELPTHIAHAFPMEAGHSVALLQAARQSRAKKTAHAAEQNRPGVGGARSASKAKSSLIRIVVCGSGRRAKSISSARSIYIMRIGP
jgi:hypothetical protein